LIEIEKTGSQNNNFIGVLRRACAVVSRYEIWVLALLVATTMLSVRFLLISVVVALVFWTVRWIGIGTFTVRTAVDVPIVILLLVMPVTWMVTVIPDKTIPQVFRLLSGIALYYAIVNWAVTLRRLRLLSVGIVLIGFVLVLMSPISVTWVVDNKLSFIPAAFYERFTILVSDTVHPNVMGGNLVLFFPIAMGLLVFSWSWLNHFERGLMLVSALAMAGVVLLTKSRGAWVSLGMVIALLALLRWGKGWLLVTIFIAIGLITYSILPPLNLAAILLSDALQGWPGRVEIASRAIYMIRDFPFTGIGMGTFENIADLLYPFLMFQPGEIVHAHNLFLQIALDLGLPGFIAWMSIFLVVIFCSLRIYQFGKFMNNDWYAGFGAGLLGSHLALTIHGLTDAVTWGMVRSAPLVWVIWGLAISLTNLHRTHVNCLNQP
jgi:putative inorganic carbon (hco3(-)) transporter